MSKKLPDVLDALRLAGRRFEAGKPIDLVALRQLIESERKKRPVACSALIDLIQKAEDAAALGHRASAMKHYRAAIDSWTSGE
jgi:hypothetical protein